MCVETADGKLSVIIPSNNTVPTKKSEIFTTTLDNQTSVEISVVQVESCPVHLGSFRLDGITPAPCGAAQVEVIFDVWADGRLNFKAIDKTSKQEVGVMCENLYTASKRKSTIQEIQQSK